MNDDPTAKLTEAQREVLRLVMAGYKSKEIAHRLGIGVDAVNKRLASAKTALNAPSRFAAARQLATFEAGRSGSHSLVSQFLAVEDRGSTADCDGDTALEDNSNDPQAHQYQVADTPLAYDVPAPLLRQNLHKTPRFYAAQLVATPARVFLLTLLIGAAAAFLQRA